MANAETLKSAPEVTKPTKVTVEGEEVVVGSHEHKVLSQEFDQAKRYVFELAKRNEPRRLPVINFRTGRAVEEQPFRPLHNIVLTSNIIWNGRRRIIRYYDGCDSVFYDKQPKEKEVIETLIRQTQRREFLNGSIAIQGYERMLLLYMYMASWNVDSPFRTQRANQIWTVVDSEEKAQSELEKLDVIEKARELSKKASPQKMKIHASYLGIELMNYDAGVEFSETELRVKYRMKAVEDPDGFLRSYGDEKIEIKFFIDKAIERGEITNRVNPNKATWREGQEICDISGLTSRDAISNKVFEYSQTEKGQEFLVQLKAISTKF